MVDVASLRIIYRDAIRSSRPTPYSPDQIRVWSSFSYSPEFYFFILGCETIVACTPEIAGFAGLETSGRVTSLFVRRSNHRQGIGTGLLSKIDDVARASTLELLYAEASDFSLPVFLKSGYRQRGTETVHRGGVSFERFLVEKRMG